MANENTASNENNSSEKQVKKRPRIQPIDELRGLAIFCMVFFHAFYTIGNFFNYEWGITLVNFFMPAANTAMAQAISNLSTIIEDELQNILSKTKN